MVERLILLGAEGGPLEVLDEYGHIIYPALGVLVIILLAASVFSAWRAPRIEGVEKARIKGDTIRLMRKNVGWITAIEVAQHLEVDAHVAAILLNEMKDDGLLTSALIENLINYRLTM